jgi:16S rRNA (cytidine1402-2'-O)-methyltransferase
MLSIVSTPIGNLGDITLRAIETLKTCEAIVCEDTRRTGQLLVSLEIPKKPLLSLHGYSDERAIAQILEKLKKGEHLALVSDAGTPGISDPGFALVSEAAKMNVKIEVVPGPAAFLAALSASGLPIHHFRYLGFLPMKKGRKTLLASFVEAEETIVFYESVHRIKKTIAELAEVFKEQPQRPIVIARELTKMHEEILHTTMGELKSISNGLTEKGEFVLVIGPKKLRAGLLARGETEEDEEKEEK